MLRIPLDANQNTRNEETGESSTGGEVSTHHLNSCTEKEGLRRSLHSKPSMLALLYLMILATNFFSKFVLICRSAIKGEVGKLDFFEFFGQRKNFGKFEDFNEAMKGIGMLTMAMLIKRIGYGNAIVISSGLICFGAMISNLGFFCLETKNFNFCFLIGISVFEFSHGMFVITWISSIGEYFCRRNLSVAISGGMGASVGGYLLAGILFNGEKQDKIGLRNDMFWGFLACFLGFLASIVYQGVEKRVNENEKVLSFSRHNPSFVDFWKCKENVRLMMFGFAGFYVIFRILVRIGPDVLSPILPMSKKDLTARVDLWTNLGILSSLIFSILCYKLKKKTPLLICSSITITAILLLTRLGDKEEERTPKIILILFSLSGSLFYSVGFSSLILSSPKQLVPLVLGITLSGSQLLTMALQKIFNFLTKSTGGKKEASMNEFIDYLLVFSVIGLLANFVIFLADRKRYRLLDRCENSNEVDQKRNDWSINLYQRWVLARGR